MGKKRSVSISTSRSRKYAVELLGCVRRVVSGFECAAHPCQNNADVDSCGWRFRFGDKLSYGRFGVFAEKHEKYHYATICWS